MIDTVDSELATDQDEEGVVDEGKAAHGAETIKSVRGQAIAAARTMGINFTPDEEKIALNLFLKVSSPFFIHSRNLTILGGGWIGSSST